MEQIAQPISLIAPATGRPRGRDPKKLARETVFGMPHIDVAPEV